MTDPLRSTRRELTERIVAASWLGDDLAEPPARQGFGRFQVLRVLGQGATSEVLLAEDPTLKRLVAIKVLHPRPGLSMDRFLQEMQVLADLRHPNIVGIYDVGVSEDERPYFVMEFGGEQALEDAEPSLDELVETLECVARACHYAHERQVVHRDLKPANIILGDRPMVADFGVAKLLGRDTGTTAAGVLVGTPAYMAPEQVGDGEVGPWTDVHALGVILYEHLTGRRPYPGGTLQELVARLALGKLTPPRQINPDVPVALDAITLSALAGDPTQRPSAEELADRLRDWRRGAPEPEANDDALPAWLVPILGAILVCLVSLGVLVLTQRRTKPEDTPPPATGASPTTTALPTPSVSSTPSKPPVATPTSKPVDFTAALEHWEEVFVARLVGEAPPQGSAAPGPTGIGPALEALLADRRDAATKALAAAPASPQRALLQGQLATLDDQLNEADRYLARAGQVEGVSVAQAAIQLVRTRQTPNPRAAHRMLQTALQLLRARVDAPRCWLFSAAWRWLGRITGTRRTRVPPPMRAAIEDGARLLAAAVTAQGKHGPVAAAYGDALLLRWARLETTSAAFALARQQLERAAQLDPRAAGPHLSLGLLHLLRVARGGAGAKGTSAGLAALKQAEQRAKSAELQALLLLAKEQGE